MRIEMREEILKRIEEADMLLIGFGEAFDEIVSPEGRNKYSQMAAKLEAAGQEWLLPAYRDVLHGERDSLLLPALQKFAAYIEKKDYFIVTVSTSDVIRLVSWKEGRLTAPCGGSRKRQCAQGCAEGLTELSETDHKALEDYLYLLEEKPGLPERRSLLGKCPKCGHDLILNNIDTEYYDEGGYLESWKRYTKWLQGTLNRKLLILELGVGMQCPTVIRFPFEKIAFYNQKAYLCRVNETLYQLTEELKEKGCSISENPVDWLQFLC